MIETIKQGWEFIVNLPAPVWAVVAGLLISWFGTQAVKFQLSDKMDDLKHRRAVRGVAMGLGFLPTFLLWPTHDGPAAVWALLTGLGAPIGYTAALRALRRYFPWLDNLSARPAIRYDKDGKAVGIRMEPDNPNDKTQYFK